MLLRLMSISLRRKSSEDMAGPTNKGNILVVDDEPQITRVLKTTLSSHGYGTRTAGDGDEALQVMQGLVVRTW